MGDSSQSSHKADAEQGGCRRDESHPVFCRGRGLTWTGARCSLRKAGTDARFDLDGNGTVDIADFFKFVDAFGT